MAIALSRNVLRLVCESPLSAELTDFARWLEAQHYTGFIVEQHVRRLAFVAPRLRAHRGGHSAAEVAGAFDPERVPRSRYHCFAATRRAYQRFLLSRGRLQLPDSRDRFGDLRQRYSEYLVDVRGLSPSTRQHHAHTVADFLARALRPRQQLRSLKRSDVERFVILRSKEVSRHSLQHIVAYIRAFLRYARDHRYIAEPLDSLDTPRTYRGEQPPRAIPWSLVGKLLASIDPKSKAGRRDRCILHLASYYGLRPSELVLLRTDSIDWASQVLHVYQPKTRSQLVLPLARRTLHLLRDYLRHDETRCAGERSRLFHRARCPHGPLERTAISDIFGKRAHEAGLADVGKNVYRLRHTFAMRLLNRGVGVKAIGDVLGHRSLESTCSYLRLDLSTLRGVALQVPGSSTRAGRRHA